MLPKSPSQVCETLLAEILPLQQQLQAARPDLSRLEESFCQVQQVFESQVLSLMAEELAPEAASRWPSLQTEVHRFLRLLAVDLLFLKSCRLPATQKQRLRQMGDRLNSIINLLSLNP